MGDASATHGVSEAALTAPATDVGGPVDSGAIDASGPTEAVDSAASTPASSGSAKLYFDVGSATPPASAEADLAGVVAALKAEPSTKARISGFHDESGGAATNAELAKERAQAVQGWLESQGIGADRIVLDKPMVTTGGGSAEEARRVEVKVE
ncbi:OmpA family protein [Lysobacter antibioticus]|uniref:OmpA family protein n=1 Tax=Lysobacter TaxID=68 RepID=UPI001F159FA3|nr:OmpA family protein [Lysobacter antibioticus]